MIYNGGGAADRATWIAQAGARVTAFEAAGPPPDHVLFQSWMVQPDRILPDSDPTTFSGLVLRYFTAHDELGSGTRGAGSNVALGAKVTASATLAGSSASAVTDGDVDTLWNSGGGPRQWIEISLGTAQTIASIRLTVAQSPAGVTDDRVYGRTAGGSLVLLHRFNGRTEDGTVLELTPPGGWTGIRAIRVETVASPSWVAWKEIEILAP
jgi:F5/8 type C domain